MPLPIISFIMFRYLYDYLYDNEFCPVMGDPVRYIFAFNFYLRVFDDVSVLQIEHTFSFVTNGSFVHDDWGLYPRVEPVALP